MKKFGKRWQTPLNKIAQKNGAEKKQLGADDFLKTLKQGRGGKQGL